MSERRDTAPLPEGYTLTADAMAQAAQLWLKQHPFAELRFATVKQVLERIGAPEHLVRLASEAQRPAIASSLKPLIEHWGENADTQSLLQAMDDAVKGEGTFMMAQAIIELARQNALERSSGQLAGERWTCPNAACGKLLDGFTDPTGEGAKPAHGSLIICTYCCQFAQVEDDHFIALSTAAFNALPKSIRKQMHSLRETVRQVNQRQEGRS